MMLKAPTEVDALTIGGDPTPSTSITFNPILAAIYASALVCLGIRARTRLRALDHLAHGNQPIASQHLELWRGEIALLYLHLSSGLQQHHRGRQVQLDWLVLVVRHDIANTR